MFQTLQLLSFPAIRGCPTSRAPPPPSLSLCPWQWLPPKFTPPARTGSNPRTTLQPVLVLANLSPPRALPDSQPRHSLNGSTPNAKSATQQNIPKLPCLIMSACCPFPPSAAAVYRTRAHANVRPVSAGSHESRGMRRLLPVAVAVVMMMTSAALGVARAQGVWSTAQLSVARGNIAAASVGIVALFAGGGTGGAVLCREGGWGLFIVVFVFCACCSIAVLFALRPLPLSCAPLQGIPFPLMLRMCTTVQQGHGRRLSSAWGALCL